MAFHTMQSSFAGGEVSPALAARVDSPAYTSWLKTARNFFVHPQGGVSNRPGTGYMGAAKYSAKACRLIPFVVGETEAYVLELGDGYIRVYTSAGRVLNEAGIPYEIASPYTEADVANVQYTQYDQMLFLAHPAYPPYRLTRIAPGRFSLEEHAVRFGPFQLENTDTSRKLRVYATQDTEIQTDGVAATLSFLPVVDPRYFVYGYFNDTLFFAGGDYGFDVEACVSAFNTRFSSSGVVAVNLGGIIQITSPQATGGAWNGITLRLTYRDSFVHEPAIVIEQQLSGGVNQGDPVATGDITYVLASNFDLFSPRQVGGRFGLTHPVESQYQTGILGYETSSVIIQTASDWTVRTSGTWSGTLVLEKSVDLGETWSAVKHFIRAADDDNITDMGTLPDQGEAYSLRLRACGITGEAGYELSAAAFVQQGVVVVTGFVSARQVIVSLERPCASDEWTADWAEGSFSPKNGYPTCVFFYQDRLGLAGTSAEPQTIWFSKTGQYHHFGTSRGALTDADPISINLSGKKLNAIHSVSVGSKLWVFTAGSEWTLSSAGALTPYNVQVEQQSERGSSRTPVLRVGSRTLFVQARGSSLRDFYYDYSVTAYVSEDLTLCAKHLFANKEIREICHQQEPDNLIWCVLSDGTLASLTYVAEQEVCAWTHHDTQGYFRSVCTIPNRGYDEMWFAVERDGQYLIEKLQPRLPTQQPQDQVFLDACVSKKSTTPFTQVEGLDHLEGKSVGVLADGSPLAGLRVEQGCITLPRAMTCVHVGLLYTAELQTLPVVFPTSAGPSLGNKQRIVSVVLHVADSRGGMVTLEGEQGEPLLQRALEPYNTPLALKTQPYVLPLAGSHTLTPSLLFTQTDPLPVTLLAVLYRLG